MTFTLFPSFIEKPEHIQFEDQDDDESIVLFLRRHWITNVGWMITAILMSLLPFLIAYLAAFSIFQLPIHLPVNIVQGIILLWYMIIFSYILESFLSWYFNIYIVTNKHLVQIQFDSLLSRSIPQSQLEDIQSVNPSLKGILASIFNYGDVEIETAAKDQTIKFSLVSHPDLVANVIEELEPKGDSDVS